MSEPVLNDCQWCSSDGGLPEVDSDSIWKHERPWLSQGGASVQHGTAYQVICGFCGARGPKYLSAELAARAWNAIDLDCELPEPDDD